MFYFIRKKASSHQHLSKQYNIFILRILESSKHWLWACFWVWGELAVIKYCSSNIRPTKQVKKQIQCDQWSDFWTAVHSECDLSCFSNQSYQADTCDLTWHYSENRYEIWHYSIYSMNHWKNWCPAMQHKFRKKKSSISFWCWIFIYDNTYQINVTMQCNF